MTTLRAAIAAISTITALGGITASQAQTVANGPYYATPSWSQILTPPARFIVLANMKSEAVLDRETGLVWQRAPSEARATYQSSLQKCAFAFTGGRFGWRVPRLEELMSLLDTAGSPAPPFLPVGHPFTIPSQFGLWSSTEVPEIPTIARYAVFTFFGNLRIPAQPLEADLSVWCVRAPSP